MTLNSFHRLLLMGLLVFFVEVSVVLLSAPQTQVLEDAICAKHLERAQQSASPNSVATLRKTCKDEAVQRELSLIKGWQNSFDMVPGFLTALPYASLADRIGRRPVATLSLLGFLTSILWIQFVCWDARVLPLRLTWASSLGLAIGGGGEVFNSMIYTMVSEAVADEQRTIVFVGFGSLSYLAEIVATPAAVALMNIHPWAPLLTADAIMVAVVALMALASAIPASPYDYHQVESNLDAEPLSTSSPSSPTSSSHAWPRLRRGLESRAWTVVRLVFADRTAAAVFVTLIMVSLDDPAGQLPRAAARRRQPTSLAAPPAGRRPPERQAPLAAAAPRGRPLAGARQHAPRR
jgi:MFS family permease